MPGLAHLQLESIQHALAQIYSPQQAEEIVPQLRELLVEFYQTTPKGLLEELAQPYKLSMRDIALITYADTIVAPTSQQSALAVLAQFIRRYKLDQVINTLHLLPFYPWDTDRGFSVEDYYQVHPAYGD